MLHCKTNELARVLLIGGWGSGKTYAWCKVVQWLVRTDFDGTVWILTGDKDVDVMMGELFEDGDEGWQKICRVFEVDYNDFNTYRAALDTIKQEYKRGDWVIVDRIDPLYNAAKSTLIDTVWEKSADKFMLDYRKTSAENPLTEMGNWGINWNILRTMHDTWLVDLTNLKCHVIACAAAEQVRLPDKSGKGGDSKQTIELFGRSSVKPAGHDMMPFYFFSILVMQEAQSDWKMTTIRDKGKARQKGIVMNDFVCDYLIGVTGRWEL